LIDDYGADGVRVGLLLSSAAGNDLMFDESLCQQGKSFANKIWNAFRLIKGWEIDTSIPQPEDNKIAIKWYESKFHNTLSDINEAFSKYRLSDALMDCYKLIWDDFCSWFLEMIKPNYGSPVDSETYQSALALFEDNLRILHPFMPFLSEEIWQHIDQRSKDQSLMVDNWPEQIAGNTELTDDFEMTKDIISGIRNIRKQKQVSFKETLDLSIINNEKCSTNFDGIVKKLCNIENLDYVNDSVDGAISFRVKSNEYFIPLQESVNVEEELKKLSEELNYTEGFLMSVQKKLQNERFVNNAPDQVVASEKQKEADAIAKIETLKHSIKGLE